jgi:hypothetical protein
MKGEGESQARILNLPLSMTRRGPGGRETVVIERCSWFEGELPFMPVSAEKFFLKISKK